MRKYDGWIRESEGIFQENGAGDSVFPSRYKELQAKTLNSF